METRGLQGRFSHFNQRGVTYRPHRTPHASESIRRSPESSRHCRRESDGGREGIHVGPAEPGGRSRGPRQNAAQFAQFLHSEGASPLDLSSHPSDLITFVLILGNFLGSYVNRSWLIFFVVAIEVSVSIIVYLGSHWIVTRDLYIFDQRRAV